MKDILRLDHSVLDELQERWPRAYKVDYGDFEIPAASKAEAESIAHAVSELLGRLYPRGAGQWSVEIEEADKRVFLVGGQRHDYYVLVGAPWKPLPDES